MKRLDGQIERTSALQVALGFAACLDRFRAQACTALNISSIEIIVSEACEGESGLYLHGDEVQSKLLDFSGVPLEVTHISPLEFAVSGFWQSVQISPPKQVAEPPL